ncbi:MAG: iron ABC transporter permease [Eubacteriales bacterium]|nr:iron ABC transporter permease [Eubacteriales bacterium]
MTIINGYRRRQRAYWILTAFLALLLAVLAAVSMIYGNTIYNPQTIFRVLSGESIQGATFTILTLRLPRTLAGVLCGLAFGMAGNTFQKLLGNPLASPDIIGVTAGSSAAAVFAILFLHLSGAWVSALAVTSGLLVSALIYLLARSGGYSNGKLILTGIGAQAFLNALISWMLLKASEYDVGNALRWLSGSLNGVSLSDIPRLAAIVFLSGFALFLLHRHLAVLQLGTSHAVTLGLPVFASRIGLILFSLLLIAFSTAVSGPIASVAFLSGPIAARLSRSGQTNLLCSGLVGAILVVASDLVAQYALPARYPVGVVTGILGAPYLIWLLLSINRKGEQ